MLSALTQLLLFQLVGETLAWWSGLPVPGPVIGMLLLFVVLLIRGGPSTEVQTTCQTILQHMSLLFVPAGVGVMVYLDRLAEEWLPLLLSVVGSTLATLAVTALVMKWCLPKKPHPAGDAT